jgi:hypothetical protein
MCALEGIPGGRAEFSRTGGCQEVFEDYLIVKETLDLNEFQTRLRVPESLATKDEELKHCWVGARRCIQRKNPNRPGLGFGNCITCPVTKQLSPATRVKSMLPKGTPCPESPDQSPYQHWETVDPTGFEPAPRNWTG